MMHGPINIRFTNISVNYTITFDHKISFNINLKLILILIRVLYILQDVILPEDDL